ncbi:15508_t:CDS:2, partial [Acaulospora morrowiae]
IERNLQKLDFGQKSNLDKLASGMLSIDIQLPITSHAKMANKILALLYSQIWIPSSSNTYPSKAISNDKNLLTLIIEVTDPQTNYSS